MPLSAVRKHYFTIQQRETLQRQLEARAEALREEIMEDAKANLNAEPEAAALELEVIELRQVKDALARLHEPDFGICSDCGTEISYARLHAQPAAKRCLACQAKAEKR